MPSNPHGTFELIARELARALEPVTERLEHHANPMPIFEELGLALPHGAMSPALEQSFHGAIDTAKELPDLIQELTTAIGGGNAGEILAKGEAVAQRVKALIASFDTIATELGALGPIPGLSPADLAAFVAELPQRLLDTLLIEYLENVHPLAFALLAALGLVEQTRQNVGSTEPVRPEHTQKSLRLDRLGPLLRSPDQVVRDVYGWGQPTFDGVLAIQRLTQLLEALGIVVTRREPLGVPPRPAIEIGLLTIAPTDGLVPPGLEATLMLDVPENVDLELPLDDGWLTRLAAHGALSASAGIRVQPPADVTLITSGSVQGELSAGLIRVPIPPDTSLVLLGVAGGSGLTAQRLGLGFLSRFQWNTALGRAQGDFGFEGRIQGGKLLIATDQTDGFLATLLSGRSLEADFDLGFGWTADRGVFFVGSGALEVQLPAHVALGPIDLTAITISLGIQGDTLPIALSANVKAALGPLTAVVEQVGAATVLSFPADRSGNLGLLQLDSAFKPPAGVGLSVDGGGFKGGGFLRFEPELAQYSGILELEFQDQLTVKAIGLLNTRLPNGQSGFSLLIVISSEFTPIQLGFGFKLNGVGGLLGLNRTVKIDRLVSGLRDNTLDSILFPTDVIANADRILSDLRQVFPPERGRFVFGPMAKITWGTPALLTADLGLIIEVPDPVRIAILGVVRAVVPSEQAAVLRLQVNFLGVIDFEKERFSFDASLFDSKLLAFTLTGDMAVRLYWGADANFLLTVGGFHPAFQPPPMNLPALRRLTLALLDGDNPRLTLETYVAVTSNTVQLGARLELYAAAWKFNAYGFLSFDVLFQLNPFYFVAEVTAMLALRVGSSSIAAIKLTLTLEGPTPWKAKGDARLRLCWFLTVKVRFNKTFGEPRNTTLPDLAVLPLLVEALSARDNWEAELPPQRHRLESLRELPAAPDQLTVHPVGTLKISQKVVPLNIRIDRMGSQRPADAREFAIGDVQVGPDAIHPPPAQESFAPAQLFDMSDQEKLASPSFKSFDSGIRVGDPDRLHAAYAAAREVQYEIKYIDSQRDRLPAGPGSLFTVDAAAFNTWTLQGATAKSDLSFSRRRKSPLAPEEVGIVQESFAIVSTGDLKPFDAASILESEHAALKRRDALIASNPALRGALQVVPAFEVVT